MKAEAPEVQAARRLAAAAAAQLGEAPAFRKLDATTQAAILRDLGSIRSALDPSASPAPAGDPYAFALETPNDLRRRLFSQRGSPPPSTEPPPPSSPPSAPRRSATETLAERAGALIDEIDFVGFVSGLIHGTFDAMVNASIKQMEAFASLVSAVAKTTDDFTRQNVSDNHARDWLVERFPQDLLLDRLSLDRGQARLRARRRTSAEDEPNSPGWLAEFNLSGENLTDDLIEQQLVPAVRQRVGEARQQTLATMVLLGMNRIVVRDGSISARVQFRAAAAEKAKVDYAASQDPGQESWGSRASSVYRQHTTMVSTVGVNAQTSQTLNATLFGEVKINFASETLPLERFADDARVALLQRHARPALNAPASAPPAGTPPSGVGTAPAPVTATPPSLIPGPSAPGT